MAAPTLDAAYAALLRDDRTAARSIVSQLLAENPKDPQAWLMLSGLVDAPSQKEDCLRRVLALDPANEAARRGVAALVAERQRALAPPPAPAPPPQPQFGGPPADAGAYDAQPLAAMPIHSMTLPASYAPPPESFARAAKPAFPWAIALGGGVVLAILAVLFVAAGRPSAPVKKPTESAQQRTTNFLNGFFTFMTRPEFYEPDRREALLDDLVGRFVVPNQRMFFNTGFNLGFNQAASPAEQQEFVRHVQRVYIANASYTVESESATEIELSVRGGEVWILLRDGSSTYVPLADMFEGAELTNIDGVWYISGIDT